MKDWLLADWCFGNPRRAYARARTNEARAAAAADAAQDAEVRHAVQQLDAEDAFLLGHLPDGAPVRIRPNEIGRHGMIWGSSGAGKSYGVEVLTRAWTAGGKRLQLIDPKGETFLLKALAIAVRYDSLPEPEREAYAAQFRVFDVNNDAVTPLNLWRVPPGMSPSLLASLRAAATVDLAAHAYSDLMAYGMFLLYSTVINLGWGLTIRIVRAFFMDARFRERVARLVTDMRLRDSIEHLDVTLPEQTRKALVRQFDVLLASAPARVSFGLGPAAIRELLPDGDPAVFLGNFGPTPQRPPALAKSMAVNRLVDVLTEANLRPAAMPELLVLEETGVLVRQPAVAEYLLEASRTLRWKGLSIVCVAQDPANAIPKETATALLLNSRWLLAFECGREEALWLEPHMPRSGKRSDAEERRAFIAEMARLRTQQAVFVRKGLPGIRLRIRDVEDPARRRPREALLDTFDRKIASRSMVRLKDAEERIAAFEASVFGPDEPRRDSARAAARPAKNDTIDDFFDFLDRMRKPDGTPPS